MSNGAIALSEHFNGSANGLGYNNTDFSQTDNITTSNSWWTAITLGTGTLTVRSISQKSAHSCRWETAVGGGSSPTADRDITADSGYVVFDAYWRFNAGAAHPTSNFVFCAAQSTTANLAQMQITTGGVIRIRNNVTTVDTSVNALVAGDYVRLAWELDYTNTTQTLRLYFGNDLHNDPAGFTEELTGTFDQDAVDLFRCGYISNPGETAQLFLDQACISYEDFVGPSYGSFNGAGVAAVFEQDATT